MGRFVIAVLLVIVAIGILVATRFSRNDQAKADMRKGSIIALVLGLLFGVWSLVRIVPANSVGVPVTFGNIGGDLTPGFHFTSPFTDITTLSTRVQELSMLAAPDEGDKKKDDSVGVVCGSVDSNGVLGSGGSASVDITIRFIVDKSLASTLFRQAGSMDVIKERFVRSDAREVVYNVFGLHTCEEGYSTKRSELATQITAQLKERLASRGIIVDSVNIRQVRPSDVVLSQINTVSATRAAAANAIEDQKKQVTEAATRAAVAKNDADAARTKAQGDADAQLTIAQAQAKANQVVSQSLTPELIDYTRALALSHASTIYVPSNGSILIGGTPTTDTTVGK